MDSGTQLALMSKAKKVFGKEDTFLSFPVSPLSFSKQQLDFHSRQDANALRRSLQNLQAFSMLVNLIPSDEAWLPSESRFLWDAYEQVLEEGIFALSSRTAEEESAYQRAVAYLRVTVEGGVGEDSPPVRVYRQFKDAYLVAQQKYLAAKSTAECSSDPVDKRQWQDIDEPAMRAELDALNARWILEGNKNEVESAQSKVVSLGAKSPILTLNEWKSRFNQGIDTLTDASNNSTVYPSFFAPSNALDEGAWMPFKLSEDEIKVLLQQAPAELRDRYAAEDVVSSVKSLTFEFSSAVIVRPWFVSNVFNARFWRFQGATEVVSNGATPRSGTCPAYVTSIVFARNIAVTERQDTPGPPPVAKWPDGFSFKFAYPEKAGLRPLPLKLDRTHVPGTAGTGQLALPWIGREEFKAASPAKVGLAAHALIANAAPKSNLSTLQLKPFTRLPAEFVQPVPAPVLATPPQSPPGIPNDMIYILAFICKTVPKCPDPDPSLQW